MATNILDAFVITFGIDTSDYESKRRDIRRGNKDLNEESTKTFDNMERKGQRLGQSFRSIRNELAGLLLVFTGTRSLIDFATGMIHTEAQAGRLGQTIGLATSRVIAWQQAVKQAGGAPGEADAALQAMANVKQDWRLTGSTGSGTSDAIFGGLGITPKDLANSDPSQILMKIAAARSRFSAEEYARRLQMIGLPQNVIYLLEQGRDKLSRQVDELEKHANVTEADAKAAQRLNERLVDFQTTVMGKLRPALTWLIDKGIEWVEGLDKAGLLIPTITLGLSAMAIAAAAAAAPWAALAGAIGLAVLAWKDWDRLQNMTDAEREEFDRRGAELRAKAWDQLSKGDIGGFLGTIWEGFSERASGAMGAHAPITETGNHGYIIQKLMAAGFTAEQARGIAAGIGAESGFDPTTKNPTSGAYGIGQWLGDRKSGLIRRYGRNPTLDQQLAYLIWELQGGDRGGAAVRRQTTADHTLLAYVTRFMRPAAGAETLSDIARGRQFLAGRPPAAGASNSSTTIGQITVHTQATDAQGIARDIRGEISKRGIVTQTDAGVAP